MANPTEQRLKRLDSITGFGLFRNYVWDTTKLKDFNRYNLVYGWNYSGKTTLSRIFQSIEDSRIHDDFSGATFAITQRDGSSISDTSISSASPVRVFNREFVLRNFHEGSDMTGAGLIAVIGESNQALKTRLQTWEERALKVSEFKTRISAEKSTLEKRLKDAATAQARTIIEIVGGPYTRTHLLNQTIPALPNTHTPLPLSNLELNAEKEQFRRAGDFTEVSLFEPAHSYIVNDLLKIRSALREVATNTAITSIQKSRNLEQWVEGGLELNTSGSSCEFCGATITKERWAALKGHFSEEFAKLQRKLTEFVAIIESVTFDAPILNEITLFPELRKDYLDRRSKVVDSLKSVELTTSNIKELIDNKLINLEGEQIYKPDLTSAKELRTSIRELNTVLRLHNSKVSSADQVRATAKTKICRHFAVDYLKRSSVLKHSAKILRIETRIKKCTITTTDIRSQIEAAQQAIKDASIAAQKVNENLASLLPGDDIIAVKLNDSDFVFQRSGQVAKNMSEGERTAVALSYFLAKLEEGPVPLSEMIVVLDDPISSLDENHIYAVHSICEKRLANALQLFILTHNSSFFGMSKDWMKGKASSFYMTQRGQDSSNQWFSTLIQLPHMLYKFKSDYQYTYCKLKLINDEPTPQFEDLTGAPNLIRNLLEAYLGFIFPEKGTLDDKLPRIIPDNEKCGKIIKFVNENSHSHSLTQATDIAAYIVHGKQIIREVLGAIQNHNPDHVTSLETEFKNEAGKLP
jgi:wobble nucleotide-excising tRNase